MTISNSNLITFKAISSFATELGEIFGDKQRSLKLYCRLINHTTIAHEKPIQKHVDAFKTFCLENSEAITNKDASKIQTEQITYSERVYINIKRILNIADNETKSIIWSHLLTIYALVDPASKAKELLLQKSPRELLLNENTSESNFLSNIITKVEENINPNANPMEAVASIMNSGIFGELINGMNNGISSNNLDLGKLMGTVQTMVSSISQQIGTDGEEGSSSDLNPMLNMIASMSNTKLNKND